MRILWTLVLCPLPGFAAASTIPPFAFDDSTAINVLLPRTTGGLTRDVILGIHGSAQPNAGIRLDEAIRGVAGSAEPNDGITAQGLGTFGIANGFDTYVGLAPVEVVIDRTRGPEQVLFGLLYRSGGPSFILARSRAGGLSDIQDLGGNGSDPALLSVISPLGFGADDVRNVEFAQRALIVAPVPLPAGGALLLAGLGGLALLRRRVSGWLLLGGLALAGFAQRRTKIQGA